MRLLGRIKRSLAALDARGAAAIEFALVGSTFRMMLLAAFEFGFMLFVQSVLDNAARDAARRIRTGQAQTSSNAKNAFWTLLGNEKPGMRAMDLSACMKLLGHSRIDLLSVDLEGDEWEAMGALSRSPLPLPYVGQLLIEVHERDVSADRRLTSRSGETE